MAKSSFQIQGSESVTPHVKNIDAELKKLNKNIQNYGKGFQDFGNVLKGSFVAGALTSLVGGIGDTVKAYQDAEKQQAKMEAVFKNTGATIGLTVSQLNRMADSWKSLTGIDDDVIKGAETTLSTFDNLSQETFPKALEASLNMSQVFGDLDTATKAVGKALNNPIEGLSALSKAGVVFSEQQKETIKKFVETNDIASAQKIILDELGSKFNGVAESMGKLDSAKFDRLKNTFDDLNKYVGKLFSSTFGDIADNLSNSINHAMDTLDVEPFLKDWRGTQKNIAIEYSYKLANGGKYDPLKPLENIKKGLDNFQQQTGTDAISFLNKAEPIINEKIKALEIGGLGFANNGAIENLKNQLSTLKELAKYQAQIETNAGQTANSNKTVDRSRELELLQKKQDELNKKNRDELLKLASDRKQKLLEYFYTANELADKEGDEQAKNWDDIQEKKLASEKKFWDHVKKLVADAKKDSDANLEKETLGNVNKALQWGDFFVSSWSRINNLIQQGEDARHQNVMANYDTELKTLDENYNAQKKAKQDLGESTSQIDEEYNTRKNAIEKRKLQTENEYRKKSFDSQKGLSMAQAGISGAQAAMSTYAQFGFPWGLIPAGIMSGITVAEIASIAQSEFTPAFANGGFVPGNSFEGDKVLARLNSGEMVLNRTQQANLYSMVNEKNTASPSFQIVVQGSLIHERELGAIVDDALNRHRAGY